MWNLLYFIFTIKHLPKNAQCKFGNLLIIQLFTIVDRTLNLPYLWFLVLDSRVFRNRGKMGEKTHCRTQILQKTRFLGFHAFRTGSVNFCKGRSNIQLESWSILFKNLPEICSLLFCLYFETYIHKYDFYDFYNFKVMTFMN